jgi:hypothetical protein
MADTIPNGALLEETETVDSLPGSPNGALPESPGKQVKVLADARKEYSAGSKLQWYLNISRSLPWGIDDVSLSFGDDIFDRMLLDAQCRAVVSVFKAGILETGPTFTSAVDRKEDDGYDQAATLVDQIERMLSDLTVSLDDVLWNMTDAVAAGNKIAEMVFALDSTITGKQQYNLTQLSVKPRESTAFVVDSFLNVLGILGRVPGQPFGVQQGMLLADIEHTANLLPRSKFAILTFRPNNNSPVGTSILRPAFDPWQQKQQLKKEFLKYLTQFATPSLIGTTPEGAQDYQSPPDVNGATVTITPEQALLQALEAFANGTALALPYGSLVKALEMAGDGAPFLNAFQFLDLQITKAVLNQTLATEEGQHQTRAASGTHKDILDTLTRQGKRPVERMLSRDVLGTWMRLNGMDALMDLMPKVSLGTAESEDLPKMWTSIAALWKAGALHPTQLSEIDRMLGLPERTPPDGVWAPVAETVTVDATAPIEPIDGDETDDSANAQLPAENTATASETE